MAKVGQSQLLACFKKVDIKNVKFISAPQTIKGLFNKATLQPENFKNAELDPNSIFIQANPENKKKKSAVTGLTRPNTKVQVEQEQRQRVYKPGPFALFYEMNEGELDKDKEVWYYKEKKDIIGPVSSYNMDKMVWFKTVTDDTKVAFETIDKFVKFGKIKAIVQKQHE